MIKSYLVQTLAALLITSASLSQKIPVYQWNKIHQAHGLAIYDNSVGKAIAVDVSGNVICAGSFEGIIDFDPGPSTNTLSASGRDVFLTKSDPQGNLIWVKKFGGLSDDYASNVTVDNNANIIVAGNFKGTVDFDPGPSSTTLTSMGGFDMFFCKFDLSGNFLWVRSTGGISDDYCHSITLGTSGNLLSTGQYCGTVDFNPGTGTHTLTAGGSQAMFLSNLDASGNFIWAKSIDAPVGNSVRTDNNGNILITGSFGSIVDFDPGTGVYPMAAGCAFVVYVLKLDSNGDFLWAKQLGGYSGAVGNSVASDPQGNVIVGGFYGYYTGTSDFDPGPAVLTLNSAGGYDVFIVKLDPSGNLIWVRSMGGTSSEYCNSICTDADGNIFSTGNFYGVADFDPGPAVVSFTASNQCDVFISELNSSGFYVWAGEIGLSSVQNAFQVITDASENLYVTGYFSGVADFDPGSGVSTFTCKGLENAFMLKMKETCFAPPTPVDLTQPKNKTICAGTKTKLNATGQGTLSWYSTPTSTISLGSGVFFDTPTLSAGIHTFFCSAFTCTGSTTPAAVTVTVNACIGIEEQIPGNAPWCKIQPNPFKHQTMIEVAWPLSKSHLFLYDNTGRLVYSENGVSGSSVKLSRDNLGAGVYRLVILDSDESRFSANILVSD